MAKPNAYYKDEKEMQDLLQRRDSFKFADPDEPSKLVVLIAGKEGSGKTHLACTMSETEPVYILDSEMRAQIVTRKFPKNVKFATVRNYMEMVVGVKHILKHQPAGSIVIDSGSDISVFSEIEYLLRTKMEKVYPIFNWGEVYAMCNAIIDDVKASQRFNLVVTARVKEEFAGDKPTGQIVPRIWSTLPYKADVVLQFRNDKEGNLQLVKNGFSNLAVPVTKDQTLPQILKQLATTKSEQVQIRKAS